MAFICQVKTFFQPNASRLDGNKLSDATKIGASFTWTHQDQLLELEQIQSCDVTREYDLSSNTLDQELEISCKAQLHVLKVIQGLDSGLYGCKAHLK